MERHEKLRAAYQRRRAKLLAVDAIENTKIFRPWRYMEKRLDIQPAVHWDKERRGFGWVDRPTKNGLRFVGVVNCGAKRHQAMGVFSSNVAGTVGWYTNPDGMVYKGGDGLCWGEVYQLTARDGMVRCVAGYRFGSEHDDVSTIDFGHVYESRAIETQLQWLDACIDAAVVADAMAEEVAEKERDYLEAQRERDDEDDAA